MRETKWDVIKTPAELKKDLGKTCSVPFCGNPLSHVGGPGSKKYCRPHQISQSDYGGLLGTQIYQAYRKPSCDYCGYTPSEDTAWKHYHLKDKDPDLFNRLCRNKLDVNHVDGDHANNNPENLATACKNCHSDITVIEEHYKSLNNRPLVEKEEND